MARGRSREKNPSFFKKIVKRSRSLPRNIGRSRSRETLVAPDFYEITPTRSVSVAISGKGTAPSVGMSVGAGKCS